jgi:hypothetical protein
VFDLELELCLLSRALLCSEEANRTRLIYMSNIVNMSFRFGGNFFYEYHKLFSRKAASHLVRGVKLDWSQVDMSIHRVVFGGCKANICQLCNSLDHGTKCCPKQISASKSQYNANKQNFKGQSDNKPFKRTLQMALRFVSISTGGMAV